MLVPASTYRVAAGVAALICVANLALDLLTLLVPSVVPSEAIVVLTASFGAVLPPLFAVQVLASADLASRSTHTLLRAKARRLDALAFAGVVVAAPLALGRLFLVANPRDVPLVRPALSSVLWLTQLATLALVTLNGRYGIRFRRLRRRGPNCGSGPIVKSSDGP